MPDSHLDDKSVSLAALLSSESVVVDLDPSGKRRLLHDLSKRAGESLGTDSVRILDAILMREHLGSTGVGMGTAIPHARLPELTAPFVLFARLPHAIDFESIDGVPVDLVFFVLLPPEADKKNLGLLAQISKLLRQEGFRSRLRTSRKPLEILQILSSAEVRPR